MNKREWQPARVDALVSQDEAVSSFNFEEFRMKLESAIRQLEGTARTIRRATLWGLGIFLLCVVSGPLLQVSGFAEHQWLWFVWSAFGVTAMFTTGVLAAVYQYRYAPALTRARSDLTSTMIADLQHKIADLNRQVNGK
jgi:hypothetical protein